MHFIIRPKKIYLLLVFVFIFFRGNCQLPFGLVDGREHNYCTSCNEVIADKPKEVLFGIQINGDGEIYFSMNNIEWFKKIFSNDAYGVTVDLVSKDKYVCGKKTVNDDEEPGLPKGTMLYPVYRPALLKGANTLVQGNVFVKIGKVPEALKGKQLEGNLVIVNGNLICFYTNFVNIDRDVWQLLPMGLFTDSLVKDNKASEDGQKDFYTYTKEVQLEIPFEKGSTKFNSSYMHGLYDSLELTKYAIRKIEVRAYSSVEGPENLNKALMKGRADTIIKALKLYQPSLQRMKIITAENWLDFFKDIDQTKYNNLKGLSKIEIKQKLTDKAVLSEMEPLLSKQRKAIITLYLDSKSASTEIGDEAILSAFQKAVTDKDIPKARSIQKEIVSRIADNKLPLDYINKIEVPKSKDFSSLLNDREVYRYMLKTTSEYEALENFLALKQLDPTNGRINYNICALRFFMWQNDADTLAPKVLLNDINALPKMGINITLVQRMLINYQILKCESNMLAYDYAGKDSSLNIIRSIYEKLATISDEDIYSIAKYYSFYSHQEWAEEIIAPRIDKIDVSEDLVFYYVNLLFFKWDSYDTDDFQKACLNAINLNPKRFCNFFLPNDKGGASMQLLDYDEIKAFYCDACKPTK